MLNGFELSSVFEKMASGETRTKYLSGIFLLTFACIVQTKNFTEPEKSYQLSHIAEPHHHMIKRSAGSLAFDPCYNYTVLDDAWRATNNRSNSQMCDFSVNWVGWYRLFLNNQSAQMPDTCVPSQSCGTDTPLWLNASHPVIQDGIVSRNICGSWANDCCFFKPPPIRVKACPGNYYVYEFQNLLSCPMAYCADINECLPSSVCGPNAHCYKYLGNCTCLGGYYVTKMNESVSSSNPCIDVDECQVNPSVCGPYSNCTNVNGGYNCSCWDGFTETFPNLPININNRCTDMNECLNPSLVCGPNSYCQNSIGSYSCSCWSGYKVAKMNESVTKSNPCTDVDECHIKPSVCGPYSNCTNVNGGYNCSCLDGFSAKFPNLLISINNTCKDIDECLNTSLVCGPNSYCHNYNGSYSCSCWSGYNVTKMNESVSNSNPCTDVNECQVNPSVCGPYSNCTNVNGGYNCSCMGGFTATFPNLLISINNTCTDINECLNSSLVCGPNSYCHNSIGSYSCSCWSGYNVTKMNESVSNSNPCTDVDECRVNPSVCGPNSNCTNVNGSYNCSCLDGFSATFPNLLTSINNTCTDINECLNTSLACGPNSYCLNSIGSYSCSCWIGYKVTKMNESVSNSNACRDVDECQLKPSVCGPYSNCTNVNGGYNCSCMDGFTATFPKLLISINNTCKDIDECLNTSLSCGPNSYCHNSIGSYSCSCWSGYNVTKMNESVSNSNPCTVVYSTVTPTQTVYSTVIPTQTVYSTVKPPQTVIKMSMTIDQPFDTSLSKPENSIYKEYSIKIQNSVEQSYQSLSYYQKGSVNVTGFRSGSTIADYTITATNSNLNLTSANTQLASILSSQGIPVSPNSFALAEEKPLINTSAKFYPQQELVLNCPQSLNRKVSWKVNEKDPDMTIYSISGDGGTLTLKNASYSDSGRFSCIMQSDSLPYIQWQNIVIEQQPIISVGNDKLVFPCDGRTVNLTCSVNANYRVEWLLNGTVQISAIGPNSITVTHKVPKENCKEEIFTCRLKDLQQLLVYSYSMTNITVKTSTEKFDCEDNTLGYGKINDKTKGLCENGKEGSITYICKSNNWAVEQDNCVLKVIIDLDSKLEVLVVQDIPDFMKNLSNVVEQNNADVIQSPATVQTVVKILSKIADLSKNITLNKPVMESFLNTVDIIGSDNSSQTWNDLNKKNTTGNTSVKLLQAIENISDRLSDVFAINLSSIQLNRSTIKNSFNQTSQLPNSTTQVIIPDTAEPNFITVIFLSKFDNVLPTRNTSNNDSQAPENSINGDVVVVRVNGTITNISFAFDLLNTQLGNPECVFWNFDLDRWDSTGCKVKSAGNDSVTCECNHTTSFSILMSPVAGVTLTTVQRLALDYITYIGVAISMISLILCLIIEMIVWKQVTGNDTSYMRHVSIVNIAVSLLIANICFIIGAAIAYPYEKLVVTVPVERCSPVVFFMHFFYLAVFFWMFISALLLLYSTVMVFSLMSRTKMMFIAFTVGYCAPLLIAVITVASTAGPQNYVSKENACWLNWNESRALLAFVIPALIIFAFNLIVVIVVVWKVLRRGDGAATQPHEKHVLLVIVKCVAFLTPIFGLTWGFGIGTMVSADFSIHVVFAFLNSLQGFFVLVFGIILDNKVRECLSRRLSIKNISSAQSKSTNTETHSSGLGALQRKQKRNVYNVGNANTVTSSNPISGSDT